MKNEDEMIDACGDHTVVDLLARKAVEQGEEKKKDDECVHVPGLGIKYKYIGFPSMETGVGGGPGYGSTRDLEDFNIVSEKKQNPDGSFVPMQVMEKDDDRSEVVKMDERIEVYEEMRADGRPFWMDRFEKEFPNLGCDERDFDGTIEKEAVKKFIKETLSESLRRADQKHLEEVRDISPTWLAQAFHDFYEGYAEVKGWKTQEKCRVEFDDLPEENKSTMICTASSVLNEIAGKLALNRIGNGEYCKECKCMCGCHPCKHSESIIKGDDNIGEI